jgi:hypothetical protein
MSLTDAEVAAIAERRALAARPRLARRRAALATEAAGRLAAIERGARALAASATPESDALALADRLRDYALDCRGLRALDELLAMLETP